LRQAGILNSIVVTGAGFERVEKLRSKATLTAQSFVAMSFASELDDIYRNGFEAGIRNAGYKPMRMDDKEHNEKICDEIVAEIRRSRFIVADFTNQSANVYYEAGFATGLGIPVIFTCNENEKDKLRFDVRQFNTIVWKGSDDLKGRLSTRISATIGDGPARHS
jgi:nucleoside 2-deoxyribosyltransferase